MTIFDLTDLHGSLRHLDAVAEQIKRSDLVIVSGDITHFGGAKQARRVIETLSGLNSRLLAVSGNCDQEDVDELLEEQAIALHGRSIELDGLLFVGLGGSLPGPVPTPNTLSEEELADRLESISIEAERPMILVSHQPPFDSTADIISSGRHVGSRSVRSFIERRKPLLCLTGHIHESAGVGTIGECIVVNPGPFSSGRYALIEVAAGVPALVTLRSL
ncbi:MAG TPA: metallophosphoesterase family protein [Spirochaetia bacterium]|nr:metallophosphoesterase family protein [Spirochaetia bacterium]